MLDALFPDGIISHIVNEFDKTPTVTILFFEIAVIVLAIFLLRYFKKSDPFVYKKFLIIAIGVFIFEFFTTPMWNNFKLGVWAYVYRDVSWILTIGWSTMILTAFKIIEYKFPQFPEWKKYISGIILLTLVVPFFEAFMVGIGIRSYSPEVLDVVSGRFIPLLNVPIHILYYVPVFMLLITGFYKYWLYDLTNRSVVPMRKKKILRGLLLTIIGVFLFELMIEPMVNNKLFPEWSYIYRDISIVMTGAWVLLILISIKIVDALFIQFSLPHRFLLYLVVAGVVAVPMEAYLISRGFREYGPSSVENFIGFTTPYFGVPVEVVFAIPLYITLIIGFVRYWELILDNKH